ncbi:MAG TPA: 2-oxoacid:ferredoxin oxidoreductase subunit gamma [Acholeplasmataceae bacterium]|jgi:2-oxoglutarate ferredoxin oxidoreductase subunit gamma|nr:2-oxoacid:ferredoxin oxidoreductase subunit gamma [Acholeplasmataceae bacterium]
MTYQIRIAGFGGQGVMVLGQMLAWSATKVGLNAMFVPTYGPETRGGTANCMVTISKDRIYSPVFIDADYFIAFNEPSYNKFKDQIKKDGTIIYNSTLIHNVPKADNLIPIAATEIAMNIGEPRSVNIVLLGEFLRKTKLFEEKTILEALEFYLGAKKETIEVNRKALKSK